MWAWTSAVYVKHASVPRPQLPSAESRSLHWSSTRRGFLTICIVIFTVYGTSYVVVVAVISVDIYVIEEGAILSSQIYRKLFCVKLLFSVGRACERDRKASFLESVCGYVGLLKHVAIATILLPSALACHLAVSSWLVSFLAYHVFSCSSCPVFPASSTSMPPCSCLRHRASPNRPLLPLPPLLCKILPLSLLMSCLHLGRGRSTWKPARCDEPFWSVTEKDWFFKTDPGIVLIIHIPCGSEILHRGLEADSLTVWEGF